VALTLGTDRLTVVGALLSLWCLSKVTESEDLGGNAQEVEAWHDLPAGIIDAMEAAGLVSTAGGSVVVLEVPKGAAEYGRQGGLSKGVPKQREKEREKERDTPPLSRQRRGPVSASVNGADRPAAEVVIRDPPGTVYVNPAKALRALRDQLNGAASGQLATEG